jgi:hypothetical protein
MTRPQTLGAFSAAEFADAHRFLASRVAVMMGRKLEEGDWAYVYCSAKNIPHEGWSNLNIDIMHESLGVEHKMLCVKSGKPIKEWCGTRLMHPAATRAIRIPSTEGDPTETAQDVLRQYASLIEQRRQKVAENTEREPDMRTGWLLWQADLVEFLYFEEEMLPPDPDDYWAEWHESRSGNRKPSKNLWVYEKTSGVKRYSITTTAGAKIQPYFDVPAPNDPHLYYFCVQGEPVENGLIRIWVTSTTAILLQNILGSIEADRVSAAIIESAHQVHSEREDAARAVGTDLAQPVLITPEAYTSLTQAFTGASDEHRMQLFAQYLSRWRR